MSVMFDYLEGFVLSLSLKTFYPYNFLLLLFFFNCLSMRTVASLVLEHKRAEEYDLALQREDPHPLRTNTVKGSFSGLGQ